MDPPEPSSAQKRQLDSDEYVGCRLEIMLNFPSLATYAWLFKATARNGNPLGNEWNINSVLFFLSTWALLKRYKAEKEDWWMLLQFITVRMLWIHYVKRLQKKNNIHLFVGGRFDSVTELCMAIFCGWIEHKPSKYETNHNSNSYPPGCTVHSLFTRNLRRSHENRTNKFRIHVSFLLDAFIRERMNVKAAWK